MKTPRYYHAPFRLPWWAMLAFATALLCVVLSHW
jgi:hypothetical protein